MNLVCDYRESHVLKRLNQVVEKSNDKYKDLHICKENLALGDFKIGNLLIERKTHQDLASSILDGRYKEQCNRLSELLIQDSTIKVVYIIEGNIDLFFNNHNIDKDKIMSCVMTLFYEKGFQVLLTKHINETSDYLLKFCLKYYNKYNKNCEITENIQPVSSLCIQTKKKSSQINKDNIGILMLCNIPYISSQIAVQLLEPFENNITSFLIHIRDNPDYLRTLKLKTKENKERKLSKNICDILIDYFHISNG